MPVREGLMLEALAAVVHRVITKRNCVADTWETAWSVVVCTGGAAKRTGAHGFGVIRVPIAAQRS